MDISRIFAASTALAVSTCVLLGQNSTTLLNQGSNWSYDSRNTQVGATASSPSGSSRKVAQEVAAVEYAQLAAWNKHDLQGYLAWYWNSPDFISLSNGDEIAGYTPFANQMRTAFGPNPSSMGQTRMDRLRIKIVGSDTAVMVAAYVTTTSKHVDAMDDTAIARRFPEGWRIVFESATLRAQ